MRLSRSLSLVALLAALIATGCKPSCSDHCEAYDECENDGDVKECNQGCEAEEKDAEKAGCETEFDDTLACYVDKGECESGDYDVKGCDDESESLDSCLGK